MDLQNLRDEYNLARRYTQSLYEDLSETQVQWRPSPTGSGIAWHLGHQAATNHVLLRNLIAAEPSLNPTFDAVFDAATAPQTRDHLPCLPDIIAYREAVAARTHAHINSLLTGGSTVAHDAAHQVGRLLEPLLVSLIHHEYQHDCWIREVRALLGCAKPDAVFSRRLRQIDGYWGL